jgi:hypothetical protein
MRDGIDSPSLRNRIRLLGRWPSYSRDRGHSDHMPEKAAEISSAGVARLQHTSRQRTNLNFLSLDRRKRQHHRLGRSHC